MEYLSDTRNRTGSFEKSGVTVKLTIIQQTGEPVQSVRATLETKAKMLGSVSFDRDKRSYFDIEPDNSITISQRAEILRMILDEIEKLFNEPPLEVETTE